MMNLALAAAAAGTTAPAVPWWGKVLVGLLMVVIGCVLGWLVQSKKVTFDLFDDYMIYVAVVVVLGGMAVMLWGLGINLDS